MKKWFKIMVAAVMPLAAASFVSCNSDDDLPNVDFTLDVTDGTVVDGTIYVAQGDTIKIAGISVKNNEAGKNAAITNTDYFWDGLFYAPAPFAPYAMDFVTTDNTPVGNHTINVTCTVLAVDKSIAKAALNYPVVVVANETEIPGYTPNEDEGNNDDNTEVEQVTITARLQQ